MTYCSFLIFKLNIHLLIILFVIIIRYFLISSIRPKLQTKVIFRVSSYFILNSKHHKIFKSNRICLIPFSIFKQNSLKNDSVAYVFFYALNVFVLVFYCTYTCLPSGNYWVWWMNSIRKCFFQLFYVTGDLQKLGK